MGKLRSTFFLLICILFILGALAGCKNRLTSGSTLLTKRDTQSVSPISNSLYNYKFVTDLEGRIEPLMQNLEAYGLRMKGNELDFINEGSRLVFGGDASDRGSHSIEIRRLFSKLKEKYPDRVTLIWGNRDLNKLGLLLSEYRLEITGKNASRPFYDWLAKKYSIDGKSEAELNKLNTAKNRVLYHFEAIGCNNCLENHQIELERIKGKKVSLEQAAKDYLESLRPGGEFYEFLSKGQFAAKFGSTLVVHGQVNGENIGIVPEKLDKCKSIEEWVKELNRWGESQLTGLGRAFSISGRDRQSYNVERVHKLRRIVQYADSNWDPSLGLSFSNENSVVYATRNKEKDNYRLPRRDVIDLFRAEGISTLVVGHSPAGNVPLSLTTHDFIQVLGDISYSKKNQGVVSFDEFGRVHVSGKTPEGHTVNTNLDPLRPNRYVGKLTPDGYTVAGLTQEGEYLLFKYQGYDIIETVASKQELEAVELADPYYTQNHDKLAQRLGLIKELQKRDVRVLSANELSSKKYEGKQFLYISSGMHNSLEHGATLNQMNLGNIFHIMLNRDKVTLLMENANPGNKLLAEILGSGFEVIAVASESTTPEQIHPKIRKAVIMGDHTLEAGLNTIKLMRQKEGRAIFASGEYHTKAQIDICKALGLPYRLMAYSGGAAGDAVSQNLGKQLIDHGDFGLFMKEKPGEDLILQRGTPPRNIPTEVVAPAVYPASEKKAANPSRYTIMTSNEAGEFFNSQHKELVTLDLHGFSTQVHQELTNSKIREALTGLDPAKHIINLSGKGNYGYGIVREMGFESVKVMDIRHFDPSTLFPKEVSRVIVMSENLEVSQITRQVAEYVDSFKPNEAKKPMDSSFHTFIDGEAANRYLQKKNKKLKYIEIPREALSLSIGEFLKNYVMDVTGPLSTASHVVGVKIVKNKKAVHMGLGAMELNHIMSFYNIIRQMGFETALFLDGANQLFVNRHQGMNIDHIIQTEKPVPGRFEDPYSKNDFRNSFEVGEYYRKLGRDFVTLKVPLTVLRSDPESFKREAAKLLAPYIANGASTALNISISYDIAGEHFPSKYDSVNLRYLYELARANQMETVLLISPKEAFLRNVSFKKTVNNKIYLTEGNVNYDSALEVSRVVSRSFKQVLEGIGDVRTYTQASILGNNHDFQSCNKLFSRLPD